MSPYTQDELEILADLVREVRGQKMTQTAASAAFLARSGSNRGHNAVRMKIRELCREPSRAKLRAKPPELDLQPRGQSVEGWLTDVFRLTKSRPKAKKVKPVKSPKPSLVLLLSDLHYGKKTATFDADEADRRLASIPDMVAAHRGKVDEAVVCLIGDLVEGIDIFPGQNITLEFGPFAQVRRCADALWLLLVALVMILRCPVRVVAIPGNHGRQSKTASRADNWDNVVAYVLALRAEMYGDERLQVEPHYGEFIAVDIKGHRCVLTHQAVSHAGTPAKQIKMATWFNHHDADIILHGHWHTAGVNGWMGRILVSNGSLCGADDYGERQALISPAQQVCFLVAPGETPRGFEFLGREHWVRE